MQRMGQSVELWSSMKSIANDAGIRDRWVNLHFPTSRAHSTRYPPHETRSRGADAVTPTGERAISVRGIITWCKSEDWVMSMQVSWSWGVQSVGLVNIEKAILSWILLFVQGGKKCYRNLSSKRVCKRITKSAEKPEVNFTILFRNIYLIVEFAWKWNKKQ